MNFRNEESDRNLGVLLGTSKTVSFAGATISTGVNPTTDTVKRLRLVEVKKLILKPRSPTG
jgi:hypothetical protein